MNKNNTSEFKKQIENEMYLSAYYILEQEISENGKSKKVIELSKNLSSKLREKAYLLSSKKADNKAIEIEKILKLTIKINGETIYG